jgi:hypothetical protein
MSSVEKNVSSTTDADELGDVEGTNFRSPTSVSYTKSNGQSTPLSLLKIMEWPSTEDQAPPDLSSSPVPAILLCASFHYGKFKVGR